MKTSLAQTVVAAALGVLSLAHAAPVPAGISDIANLASIKSIESAAAGIDDAAMKISAASGSDMLGETGRTSPQYQPTTSAYVRERRRAGRPKGSKALSPEERSARKRARSLRRSAEQTLRRKSKAKEDIEWHEDQKLRARLRSLRAKFELKTQADNSAASEPLAASLVEEKVQQNESARSSYTRLPDSLVTVQLMRPRTMVEGRGQTSSTSSRNSADDNLREGEGSHLTLPQEASERDRIKNQATLLSQDEPRTGHATPVSSTTTGFDPKVPDLNEEVSLFDLNALPGTP